MHSRRPPIILLFIIAWVFAGALLCPFEKTFAGSLDRAVNLDWEPVEGATSYEIKFSWLGKKNKNKTKTFKSKNANWRGILAPGLYNMQLRSLDDRKVPGEWSEASEFWVKLPSPEITAPPSQANISTEDEDEHEVEFKWLAVEGAAKYKLSIKAEDKTYNQNFETTELSYKVNLPVAKKYSWTLISKMTDEVDGDTADKSNSFVLVGPTLKAPEIEKPLTKFVKEIHWKSVKNGQKYSHRLLYLAANKKWKVVNKTKNTTNTKIDFDLAQNSGIYKIQVRAEAKYRKPSETSQLEFEVSGGLRTPAAIEAAILRESLTKPTSYYGIASYFLTSMDYKGVSRDGISGSNSSFDAVGGTGRIGLGYQNAQKPIGYYGVLDMSGFNLNGKTFNFSALELHSIYQMKVNDLTLLRFGAGLYAKEIPLVSGSVNGGFSGLGKINHAGPHVGFQLWRPLNEKLGIEANARLYYSLFGDTPEGQAVQQEISYQLGLLGSYRLKPNLIGFAGYAYRADRVKFDAIPNSASNPFSFGQEGDTNSVEIMGHYLNLILEYSF